MARKSVLNLLPVISLIHLQTLLAVSFTTVILPNTLKLQWVYSASVREKVSDATWHDTPSPNLVASFCASTFPSAQTPVFPVIRHFTAPVLIAQIDSFTANTTENRATMETKRLRLRHCNWYADGCQIKVPAVSCQKRQLKKKIPTRTLWIQQYFGVCGKRISGKDYQELPYPLGRTTTLLLRCEVLFPCYCSFYHMGFIATSRIENFFLSVWQSFKYSCCTHVSPVGLLCNLLNLQHRICSAKSTATRSRDWLLGNSFAGE